MNRKIHIAIPVINEEENLPTLIQCIKKQDFPDYHVSVCINQPDSWWNDQDKKIFCENNTRTARFLQNETEIPLTVIDRFSCGKGWSGKKTGIGWARKTVLDSAAESAAPNDILISADADTLFPPDYFSKMCEEFDKYPEAGVVSIPYYHNLTGNDRVDRSMLRYEIYMRNYAINLLRSGNPYGYTALGSAIALTVYSYRKIKGITPKPAGEDFYFLQKLRKQGKIRVWSNSVVYPAARFSDRVYFGTGPAMKKIDQGLFSAYPIFHHSHFDQVSEAYRIFPELYTNDISIFRNPFLHSLDSGFNWDDIRKNCPDAIHLARSCNEIFDGLRIFQFLRSNHDPGRNDEQTLIENMGHWNVETPQPFSFQLSDIQLINKIRNQLFSIEQNLQRIIIYV
ncbi:MAG: glycosyltransferase [Bacteroidetes bacterium]|nr:glycosyltransferase [Bacteroidota bacterium]MBU1720021.1 glycosyltransferase [Bacteroidota bacterium]